MKSFNILSLLLSVLFLGVVSCEDSSEVGEYDNWKERNMAFIDSIASVARVDSDGKWKIFSVTGLDENKVWANDVYVYCNILQAGGGTEHPAFNDTIELYYRGRLIPSKSYPKGYVFDSSYDGELEPEFDPTTKMLLNNTVPGFYTAIQHMVKGDVWRVYIPATLGYGATEKTGIPAYSDLIFDINLISFSHVEKK